jgi:L-ascorbate metabolism protein UlaG (beta-lactamase superfamily)
MKRRSFIQSLFLLGVSHYVLPKSNTFTMIKKPTVQLLRHATLLIEINSKKILVDPMLSLKDEMDPVTNSSNSIRIPMTELPFRFDELLRLLNEIDAVVITHLHRDHWDLAAQKFINKNKLIFCQPTDMAKISEQGFTNIKPIEKSLNWEGIEINRTGGKHGTGAIGQKMGEVSGFVFQHQNDSIYVAGDTIWCDEVEKALSEYKPKTTIVNAGAAQFLTGGPITMTPEDIITVNEKFPNTKIIAVHMDTVNHCHVKRTDLTKVLSEKNKINAVIIPKDGEVVLA